MLSAVLRYADLTVCFIERYDLSVKGFENNRGVFFEGARAPPRHRSRVCRGVL